MNNAERKAIRIQRAHKFATLFKSGQTLQQIASGEGITRERVRQLIAEVGVVGKDGGQKVQAERNRLVRAAKRDERMLKSMGCTYTQWRMLLAVGKSMSLDKSPLGAFRRQRQNAKARGIGWELNIWQWWTIWQESGHWEQRGRGAAYVMARKNDEGSYAVGNVFITTGIDNASNAPKKKKTDLPLGVSQRRNRFHANRMIGGVKYHIGSFADPLTAHNAYLQFRPEQVAA